MTLLAFGQMRNSYVYVSSKECNAVEDLSIWKHAGGVYRRFSPPHSSSFLKMAQSQKNSNAISSNKAIWQEVQSNGEVIAYFEELQKDTLDNIVVLGDVNRGLQVLLRRDLAAAKMDKDKEFQQLYAGGWLKVGHCE